MNATKSKRIIALLAAIVLSVGLSLAVSASSTTEPPLLGGNLIWNIESIYYYVDSSANSFVTPIANAAYNWVYTGYGWNNLYPNSRTYNITYSAIDIYGYSSADGNNGYTTFWARTNGTTGNAYSVNPNSQNWLFNEVKLNSKYLSNQTDYESRTISEMLRSNMDVYQISSIIANVMESSFSHPYDTSFFVEIASKIKVEMQEEQIES